MRVIFRKHRTRKYEIEGREWLLYHLHTKHTNYVHGYGHTQQLSWECTLWWDECTAVRSTTCMARPGVEKRGAVPGASATAIRWLRRGIQRYCIPTACTCDNEQEQKCNQTQPMLAERKPGEWHTHRHVGNCKPRNIFGPDTFANFVRWMELWKFLDVKWEPIYGTHYVTPQNRKYFWM